MNILVTGASGFIGSYLVDFFAKEDYSVIATSRNTVRIPPIQVRGFRTASWDVLKNFPAEGDFSKIDAIIHTATSNDIIARKAGEGILLSALGTKNVLDFCLTQGIPNIIFFSTFQVYGTELNGEIDEQTTPLCQNDYGLNHVFGEQYVEMYSREKGINGIVVRPSNVYGRLMTPFIDRWTLVPGCFCKEIMATGKIILRSSGRQTRNFVNLENIGRALDKIMKAPKSGFDIYNIASTNNYSMLEVAHMVNEVYRQRYSKEGIIEILGTVPAVGNSFKVNLQKLYDLGFAEDDSITLKSEINEIFNYLEKYQKNESSSTI